MRTTIWLTMRFPQRTLLHHGLLAPFDVAGLAHQRDYATLLQSLHKIGSRPGADITLAALSEWTGRLPYEVFMPLIFALGLCGACGAGALAMQATSRWWAAAVAAAFLLISPLATFGALQQLLPQVWGLGLATALFALLMRVELHEGEGAKLKDLVPIALLAAGIILVYVELASIIAVAYALYVVSILVRGKVESESSGTTVDTRSRSDLDRSQYLSNPRAHLRCLAVGCRP